MSAGLIVSAGLKGLSELSSFLRSRDQEKTNRYEIAAKKDAYVTVENRKNSYATAEVVINQLAGHVKEWQQIKEQEKTNRNEISAKRDFLIENIRAEKEKFLKTLELNYKERAEVYKNSFATLDKALESGNVEVASFAMNAIIEQIKNNPLPSFGEFKQSFLSNETLDF